MIVWFCTVEPIHREDPVRLTDEAAAAQVALGRVASERASRGRVSTGGLSRAGDRSATECGPFVRDRCMRPNTLQRDGPPHQGACPPGGYPPGGRFRMPSRLPYPCPMPKKPEYASIAEMLKAEVLVGRYDSAPMPSNGTLTRRFDVNIKTAGRPVQQLVAEGILMAAQVFEQPRSRSNSGRPDG